MTLRGVGFADDRGEKVAIFIIMAVLAVGAWQAWTIHQLEAQVHVATTQRDSLAGEAAAERARARGFEVAFGKYVPHLAKQLKQGDSILAETIGDLQVSRVRITQLNRLTVRMQGQISSMGTPSAPLTDDPEEVPPSWVGEYDDGLLSGSWRFTRVPTPLMGLDYFLEPEIELVQGVAGDGRTVVLVRGLDTRVSPIFTKLVVDPLPPVIELHCPATRLATAGLIGAGLGLLLKKE
jgi:hypothetical protein